MNNTTQQTQRITPRHPVPEFLRADPAAELRELRKRVRELEASPQVFRPASPCCQDSSVLSQNAPYDSWRPD